MPTKTPSTRLSILLARGADVGVILRRGPSKQVLLVRWDLQADTFEAGQWLKGRVYERRCDLSPSGERLIYFAGAYRGPVQTWTAVSRPPYFTAVAFWPKGDAWGGGGLFAGESSILLNHPASKMTLGPNVRLPSHVKVSRSDDGGKGEDLPIFAKRMALDGWTLTQEGTWHEHSTRRWLWWTCDPPDVWSKPHPKKSVRWALEMHTLGIHKRQGPWDVFKYVIVDDRGAVVSDLGEADWADWQASGDLLFARDGKIFRSAIDAKERRDPRATARELIDLSGLRFEARPPVPEATRWRGPRPRGVVLDAAR